MITENEIIDYILQSPENTNGNILKQMLRDFSGGSSLDGWEEQTVVKYIPMTTPIDWNYWSTNGWKKEIYDGEPTFEVGGIVNVYLGEETPISFVTTDDTIWTYTDNVGNVWTLYISRNEMDEKYLTIKEVSPNSNRPTYLAINYITVTILVPPRPVD